MNKDIVEKNIEAILSVDDLFIDLKNSSEYPKKCSKASTEARVEGNKIYQDKKHDETSHKKILLLYTKSAAIAPASSEELALAYSNRAALFLYLHKYRECLIDTNRALQITSSDKLKTKLLKRQTLCLTVLNNSNASDHKENFPEMTSSKNNPFASRSVTLQCNKKYGRHLLATRDIKIGEIVAVEEGYITVPQIAKLYLVCSHCLNFACNAIPCDFCTVSIYCTEKCKSNAWIEYHDVECSILPLLYCLKCPEVHINTMVGAMRIFIIAVKNEGIIKMLEILELFNERKELSMKEFFHNGIFENRTFKSFCNLSSFLEKNNDRIVKDSGFGSIMTNLLFRQSCVIRKYIEDMKVIDNETLLLMKFLLMKIKWTMEVNLFTFQDSVCKCGELKECSKNCEPTAGWILTIFCSLFNHSCHFNVGRIFIQDRRVVLFATNPINKGEQLFVCYGVDLTMPIIERQMYLMKNFNFHCECSPCKENWPLTSANVHYNINLLASTNFMIDCVKHFNELQLKSLKICHIEDSPCDKKVFEKALKLVELEFKHFNKKVAVFDTINYISYINRCFIEFYGIKYNLRIDY